MTEITNTSSFASTVPTTNAPARQTSDAATSFSNEMMTDDGANDAQELDGQNLVDENDQDLYHGLGDGNRKSNSRRKEEQARNDPRFRFKHLASTTDPHDAGVMLRISLGQHGIHRENFLSHANYVNKLGSDAAADYFNALSGTHCCELGLYATGFAYTDWPTFCLDSESDLNVLESAWHDRRLNANSEILHGRVLPELEKFSEALAVASNSERWLDNTSDEIADRIASMEFAGAQEVAAMRLFDTGAFSARLLSPILDETVQRLPMNLAAGDARFGSLHIALNAASTASSTAVEIMASDQLTDDSIERLASLKLPSTENFLDSVRSRNNVGIDPAATALHSKIEGRLEQLALLPANTDDTN